MGLLVVVLDSDTAGLEVQSVLKLGVSLLVGGTRLQRVPGLMPASDLMEPGPRISGWEPWGPRAGVGMSLSPARSL